MGIEFPDWLRGIALVGKYGSTYLPVATDPSGQLYIVLTGAPEITIPGDVNVNDLNTVKQIQGTDGTDYRTAKLDSSGQFIIVPRGQSGNYMAVDASGFLTTVMKGLEGATLRTVAVDASGNMIGVMKGDYGGVLKTIGVDDLGHMYAYVQDETDQWGNRLAAGISELAARLGALKNYDRRGQLLQAGDFSNGMENWIAYGDSTYTVALDPTIALRGGYSVKVLPVLGAGNTARIEQMLGSIPASKRIGCGVWIKYGAWAEYFTIDFQYADGSNYHVARVRLQYSTGQIHVYNNASGWTLAGTWPVNDAILPAFRFLKLVIDTSTRQYLRVITDQTQIDVSATSYYSSGASTKFLLVRFQVESSASKNGPVYVDSFETTSMEPANA